MKEFNLKLVKDEPKKVEEDVITIVPPLPKEVAWHTLTHWRHAKELYNNHNQTWQEWKKKSKIPHWVIEEVENQ